MSGMSQGTGVAPEIARLVLTTSENAPMGQDKKLVGSTLEMHVVDVTLKLHQQSFFNDPI